MSHESIPNDSFEGQVKCENCPQFFETQNILSLIQSFNYQSENRIIYSIHSLKHTTIT